MSSFLVETHTILKIVGYIDNVKGFWQYTSLYSMLKNLGYDFNENGMEELCTDMMELNHQAINARYGDNDHLRQLIKFEYVHATKYEVLKKLQCWLYQCFEGDVPKDKLYQAMKEVERVIMRDIIDSIPEYADAEWR